MEKHTGRHKEEDPRRITWRLRRIRYVIRSLTTSTLRTIRKSNCDSEDGRGFDRVFFFMDEEIGSCLTVDLGSWRSHG